MKVLVLAMSGIMLLSGCAGMSTAAYDRKAQAYSDECQAKWGLFAKWTPEQLAEFKKGIEQIQKQNWASYTAGAGTGSSSYVPRQTPVYQPPPFEPLPEYHPTVSATPVSAGPIRITPDPQGGYTAYGSDGSTSQARPDGRGGYNVYDSDGTVHRVVPDHHGGWTIYP